MLYYVAVVSGGRSEEYDVTFPDFPEVRASHVELDAALSRAEINLFLHTNALRADDRKIPAPRSVDQIMQDDATAVGEGAFTVVPLLPSAPMMAAEAVPSNPFLRYLGHSMPN